MFTSQRLHLKVVFEKRLTFYRFDTASLSECDHLWPRKIYASQVSFDLNDRDSFHTSSGSIDFEANPCSGGHTHLIN